MQGSLIVVDDVATEFAARVVQAFHTRPNEGFSLVLSGGETARGATNGWPTSPR